MLSSKPKSGLTDTSNTKTTPPTPKMNKIGRAKSTRSDSGSPSPLQNSRVSPKTVESKPAVERRSSKVTATPDKPLRSPKGSESKTPLSAIQEDLKKAREQLASVEVEKNKALEGLKEAKTLADSVEQEKTKALEDLKEAKRLAEEASEKLKEALVSQQKAEESSEIEKFRADELVQASIEASRKREEEWKKEMESIKNEHSLDVRALLSVAQELEKVKHELEVTKNTSNGHGGEALKLEFKRTREVEGKLAEMEVLVEGLKAEVANSKRAESESHVLIDELRKREGILELQLVEANHSEIAFMESLTSVMKQLEDTNSEAAALQGKVESLEIEVADSKRAELDSSKLAEELEKRSELLEVQLEEAIQSEKSSLESLGLVKKQLAESNALLQDAESEIIALRGKMELLEAQLAEAKQSEKSSLESLTLAAKQMEESNSLLQDSESETATLRGKIQSLEIEVDHYKEEAAEMGKAVEDLKSMIQTLDEEKLQALDNEKVAVSKIEILEEEKEELTDELVKTRDELENVKNAREGLALALDEMSTEAREAQERLLMNRTDSGEAVSQIDQLRLSLKNTEENYEVVLDEARYEIVCLKKLIERFETEANDSKAESISTIKRLEELEGLKFEAENEVKVARNETAEILIKFEQAESRFGRAKEDVEKTKAETLRLKEKLLDKENELQCISQENEDLRIREAAATRKLNDLSASLADATNKKPEENSEQSNSEKEYDLLPNSKDIPNLEDYKAIEKELSLDMENEGESIDDELDLKTGIGSFDMTNGLASENAEENGAISSIKQHKKKKTPLMHKFGSLLKKKNSQKD